MHGLVARRDAPDYVAEMLRQVGLDPSYAASLPASVLRRPARANRHRAGAGGHSRGCWSATRRSLRSTSRSRRRCSTCSWTCARRSASPTSSSATTWASCAIWRTGGRHVPRSRGRDGRGRHCLSHPTTRTRRRCWPRFRASIAAQATIGRSAARSPRRWRRRRAATSTRAARTRWRAAAPSNRPCARSSRAAGRLATCDPPRTPLTKTRPCRRVDRRSRRSTQSAPPKRSTLSTRPKRPTFRTARRRPAPMASFERTVLPPRVEVGHPGRDLVGKRAGRFCRNESTPSRASAEAPRAWMARLSMRCAIIGSSAADRPPEHLARQRDRNGRRMVRDLARDGARGVQQRGRFVQ